MKDLFLESGKIQILFAIVGLQVRIFLFSVVQTGGRLIFVHFLFATSIATILAVIGLLNVKIICWLGVQNLFSSEL
jgi:hypothetical protein